MWHLATRGQTGGGKEEPGQTTVQTGSGAVSDWVMQVGKAIITQDGVSLSKLFRIPVYAVNKEATAAKSEKSAELQDRLDRVFWFASDDMINMSEAVMSGICVSCLNKAFGGTAGSIATADNSLSVVAIHNLLQNRKPLKTLCVEYLKIRQLLAMRQEAASPTNADQTAKSRREDGPTFVDIVKQGVRLLDCCMELYLNPSLAHHNWLVPCLAVICDGVSKAGIQADAQEESAERACWEEVPGEGEDETQHRYTKEVLNSIRGKLGRCRGDEDRHGAYIVLLGESIKGCIQLRNMQMAAGFLKAIESQRINCHRVPRSSMVSFRFYLGKLYMQQDAFEKAERELVWAFSNSSTKSRAMRRNILECLVAVRLRMGIIPSNALLDKYRMAHYLDIVGAVKTGDIKKFDNAMETYARELVHHGTILCVERVKFIVYRTLMRQIKDWWVNRSGLCTKPNIVPIAAFAAGIKWQSDELFDQQEMACICANLIRAGYVKGYISWEHMVIVFSSVEPFPKLRAVRTA